MLINSTREAYFSQKRGLMKNKIILIVLIVAFIGIMFLLNNVLQNESNKKTSSENIVEENKEEEKEMVIEINSENFATVVLKSDKTVLIDFYANWCGPCKMLSPIVEQFASENDDIKVVKINVDNEQDLAVEYGVMSIPTLVVIKNGQEANRVVGLISKDEIKNLVK